MWKLKNHVKVDDRWNTYSRNKASKPYFKIKKTQSFFWLYAVLLFPNEFSTSEMRADNQVHLCTMNPPVFCPFYQVNSKYYT